MIEIWSVIQRQAIHGKTQGHEAISTDVALGNPIKQFQLLKPILCASRRNDQVDLAAFFNRFLDRILESDRSGDPKWETSERSKTTA